MFLKIAAIIIVLWLLGLIASFGGQLIHLLLVVALIMVVLHFLKGRTKTTS